MITFCFCYYHLLWLLSFLSWLLKQCLDLSAFLPSVSWFYWETPPIWRVHDTCRNTRPSRRCTTCHPSLSNSAVTCPPLVGVPNVVQGRSLHAHIDCSLSLSPMLPLRDPDVTSDARLYLTPWSSQTTDSMPVNKQIGHLLEHWSFGY